MTRILIKKDVFRKGYYSIHKTSNGYEKAKTKILLETTFFIGDLTIKQV